MLTGMGLPSGLMKMFSGDTASVGNDEKVLEMDSGDGCTTM